MNEQELDDMAAGVARSLKWAGFLLAAMLVILLVDLQLKRSIGKTAVLASERHALIVDMADRIMADLGKGTRRGREPVAPPGSAGGDTSHDGNTGMVGDAAVAAGTDPPGDPPPDVPAPAPGRPGQRTPGNGRRAGRTAGGG